MAWWLLQVHKPVQHVSVVYASNQFIFVSGKRMDMEKLLDERSSHKDENSDVHSECGVSTGTGTVTDRSKKSQKLRQR